MYESKYSPMNIIEQQILDFMNMQKKN